MASACGLSSDTIIGQLQLVISMDRLLAGSRSRMVTSSSLLTGSDRATAWMDHAPAVLWRIPCWP